MLDLVCTFHNYKELKNQVEIFKDSKYTPNYICNWENKKEAKEFASSLNINLNWLDYNPNQHDGTYGLAASANELLTNKYVLHYHADIIFKDISKIEESLNRFIDSNKKLAGIPRQWQFDDEGIFIDTKSLPFRSEVFITTTSLYKKMFDFNRFEEYRLKSRQNGHPSLHFEPTMYAAAEVNGVDFSKDIFYLEDPLDMRKVYGNNIFYYNELFENTQIIRIK